MSHPLPPFDAVILAGGAGRRLGGVDKPALAPAGARLVDVAISAAGGAQRRVVVGPPRPLPAGVWREQEHPPGGGPSAALTAGLTRVTAPYVAVLAADLPFLGVPVVEALRRLAGGRSGAVLCDATGRVQLLVGVWRRDELHRALAAAPCRGRPLREALRPLLARAARFAPTPPAGQPPPWWDCDAPADLVRAADWVAGRAV